MFVAVFSRLVKSIKSVHVHYYVFSCEVTKIQTAVGNHLSTAEMP